MGHLADAIADAQKILRHQARLARYREATGADHTVEVQ
jgi:hypothetical protein